MIFGGLPTIFGRTSNFFFQSRSADPIFENQGSNFRVTGHRPFELNKMVQNIMVCSGTCQYKKVNLGHIGIPELNGHRILRSEGDLVVLQ